MVKLFRPDSLEELLELYSKVDGHIFAGGTDLMIRKRQWQGAERKFTKPVIYINQLEELKGIKEFEDRYEIMTLTTQSEIINSDLPDYIKVPISKMGNPAVRNVATIGGNIVNAASVGDSIVVFIALDAELELMSKEGIRYESIEEFEVGKYKTDLHSGEILSKIIIKKQDYDFFYKKLGQRKASILSKLSVYILKNETDIKIAIGAVNNKVIRSVELEEKYMKDNNLEELLYELEKLMHSFDDKRSTKDYREHISIGLVKQYLGGLYEL